MFAIVAEKYQYVVGVDTHAQKHVATIVNNQGVVLAIREIRVTDEWLYFLGSKGYGQRRERIACRKVLRPTAKPSPSSP